MAGNSVPIFFGAKAPSKRPPGVDVTSILDLSGSMGPYAAYVSARSTFIALESALVAEGVGILSSNRYSFASGGGSSNLYDTLAEIERPGIVSGVPTIWVPGANILDGTGSPPALRANAGGNTEDMGLAVNLVSETDRSYLGANLRVIIAGSDEQSYSTAFVDPPAYSYRYVGVHRVALSLSEPAGPNPIPAGTLVGFVYTTGTTGAAIYLSGSTINYRLEVPVANMTATATNGTLQLNVDRAAATNGAIYNITAFSRDYSPLGESLGSVLGRYLYDIS